MIVDRCWSFVVDRWVFSSAERTIETSAFSTSCCKEWICIWTFLMVEQFLSSETFMKLICSWLTYWCFCCIALVIMLICPTANWIVSILCMVDSIVEWRVVGNVGRCSSTLCLVMISVDWFWDGFVDRCCIPYPIGTVGNSIFLSTNTSILCSSLFLVILIVLLCMQISSVWRCCNLYCKSGIVVVILPTVNRTLWKIFYYVVYTTVVRFFEVIVDRFLIGTIDRCGGVSFDRCGILCLVLRSTVKMLLWVVDHLRFFWRTFVALWLELDHSRRLGL